MIIHLFHTWSEWIEDKRKDCKIFEKRVCNKCSKIQKRLQWEHEEIIKDQGEEKFFRQMVGRIHVWKLYECKHCGQLRGDSQYETIWDLT